MGRGAAVDGNGHAVLPPGTLTRITRYRQPPPPRRSGIAMLGRLVLWLVTLIVMLIASMVGGYYLFLHESVAAVTPHSRDVKIAQRALNIPQPGQPAVALIVGYDHRAGVESNLDSRSDTIMLVRADPQAKAISMLSFPRDLLVEVRCPRRAPYVGRINSAYADCGSVGTLDTVRALTDVPVNYLITVNFHGFKQIVDRLGGVWIDVDRRYFNDNSGRGPGSTYATINLQPGYQKLNGSDALDYVRYRHTDSDLYRVARQQLFVKAVKEQITKSFVPLSLPRIVGAITKNVEVGQGGGQELSLKTVLSYAFFAYKLPSGHFFQARINGLSGYAELTTATSNIHDAVDEFMNPDVAAPTKAATVALGLKPKKAKTLPAASVSVTVLNGNGVAGAASNAGYLLGQRGYRVITGPNANAPTYDYFHTKVYYDPAQSASKVAAQQVSRLFGAADIEAIPPDIANLSGGAMLTVVVGQTFHGTIAPAPIDRTPKRQPPVIRKDPAATIGLLRPLRSRVPFTLQLPTILERTSSADRELPVRIYPIQKDHRAVRLTFRTGGNEYWGIEESDWEDAPILSGSNVRHVIGGREFYFYFSGAHLHMVVLRTKGASYWVVNTLLDSLSNETMVAIAKGLRPLSRS